MEGTVLRQLVLREVTVRFVILLGVLSALSVLVGCVNRDKQRLAAELEEEFAKAKAEELAKALAVQSAIDRQYGGEARCPKCSEDWDIDRIELETTGFDGILRAKVYVKCPKHGNLLSEVSEWYVSDDSVQRVK